MDYIARTPSQLGAVLKSCRKRKNLSQSVAGAKVGLTQRTVSVIEADAARSGVDTLYKLLSALGLELVIRDKASDDEKTQRPNTGEW